MGTNTTRPALQLHSCEELKEIDAVVRDEREFIPDDSVSQVPVGLTAQSEMIDVGCFEPGAMSDSSQRLMQAFVDEEPHARLSREVSG